MTFISGFPEAKLFCPCCSVRVKVHSFSLINMPPCTNTTKYTCPDEPPTYFQLGAIQSYFVMSTRMTYLSLNKHVCCFHICTCPTSELLAQNVYGISALMETTYIFQGGPSQFLSQRWLLLGLMNTWYFRGINLSHFGGFCLTLMIIEVSIFKKFIGHIEISFLLPFYVGDLLLIRVCRSSLFCFCAFCQI